ncbi:MULTISPECIES: GtrA family protein [Haloarcula]|uniref:Sugar translocase n=1 Tax=Haloarcula pellucida TaxID=1427151 RepID=A0A830GG13_9EURY|nr:MULTISPECIES: GtrA family protein [Halomicroarcula]MBX0347045.1 GtrA family protein [Halomicroarcula pellucida]MDS0277080.1 GtrA family protein [Halomicroarcula sp. S1AR25-4]GGN86704.1 sugar translocase [Halomicroarcula pellucida]
MSGPSDRLRHFLPDRFESLVSGVRFGQFLSVGVVGAISDNTVLAILGLVFDVPDLWAKAAGIETAILVMFLVNEHWTFSTMGATGRGPFLKRLVKSHIVRSGGVTIQLLVYWVLTQYLAIELVVFETDLWFIAASPIAIAIAMVVNYVFESLFTWQVHRDGAT